MSTPASISPQIAIIGGGISGLSAAWYLRKQAREQNLDVGITVLEASDRWGGKVQTEQIGGYGDEPFIIEHGPDSFLTQKPAALQLAHELGLQDRLLPTNDAQRKIFVLNRGKLTPLPDGIMLIVPTRLMPFALSPLLSPLAKLRMSMDLFIPAKRDAEDETIAEFILRRLGREALDKIAEPMMSGIYSAESDKQSLLATFPRFRALEQQHGSLIKGMLASRRGGSQTHPDNVTTPFSMFTSLRCGMHELIEALVAHLSGDAGIELRLNTKIDSLTRQGGSQTRPYNVQMADGHTINADAVILTTPSYITATLVQPLAPDAARSLSQIRYGSTGTISLAYKRSEITHPLNGFGLVIPRSENCPINAITWTSTKFDHRAPDDHVLLRVFFGGSHHQEMMQKSDEELIAIVQSELAALMGITACSVLHRIYRWHDANPQYDKGHLQRVDAIEAALPKGLYVTGNPYRGIGIPDCVAQSVNMATRVINEIKVSQ